VQVIEQGSEGFERVVFALQFVGGVFVSRGLQSCLKPHVEQNWASIMAPATPFCFWTTQKRLTVKRTMG
jgi:hypothetical protein